MATRHVLIVEDDVVLRESLASSLAEDGEFLPVCCGSADEATALLSAQDARFDTMILDLGLPDGDGRELCLRIREMGISLPVIMLTGRADEADLVSGFESGANDYIVKPFRLSELVARLRTHIRVFEATNDAVFQVGIWDFKPSTRMLNLRGGKRKIKLTDKEGRILRMMLGDPGQPFARQRLLDVVWGYSPAASTHTLETHVYRLRQKLEADPHNPAILQTTSSGYVLIPDGRQMQDGMRLAKVA
jgi:DNA-binding response OmpR family regulator